MSDFKYCQVNCEHHSVLFDVKTGDTICVWTNDLGGCGGKPRDFHPQTAVYNVGEKFMTDKYGSDFGWGHMVEQAMNDQSDWVEV